MGKSKTQQSQQDVPPPLPEPLPRPVADSHTHMDMQGRTPQESVELAASVNVTTLVQVGCDVPSSEFAVAQAAAFASVHATVALHPNEAPRLVLGDIDAWAGRDKHREPGGITALEGALARIEELAGRPEVVGIGETGLDYFRTGPEGVAAQQESFRRHIALAKRVGKALVIHDRDAHADVLRILREEGAPDRVVFHCYSGDAAMARECAEAGYYLSFAGPVTFKANEELRAALRAAPMERVLVETDAPFLTPVPYRGRPNAPYLIPLTVRSMAETLAMDLTELCEALDANTRRVFELV
ncbi:TatD family hydrolase [Actinospica durhamensis]|uniref:TatD family hydrolase n=1 Tax=Actinospica durhamensis TaxID=1508375 RepID=A0A941EQX4_9ACTN|nr:TatD family hydrolase [Actinospica durhamensis]MBR7835523.1 TatD family hydrolase [Actinospica durhamensis]